MNKNNSESKILKQEVITDQSDPRMVEFRESHGEFQPSCKRKTIRLVTNEYGSSSDKLKVTTKFGYYEGEPPPRYREFFSKLCRELLKR